MADTTIDPSAVVSAFGSFYLDAGQGENNIFTRLVEPFGTMSAFTIVETEDTIVRESSTVMGEVVQAYQDAFTPKGSIAFIPKEIKLFNLKMDQSFVPNKLRATWFGFLTSKNLDNTTWPFVRWFVEIYCMKQFNADLEKIIFAGSYVAPTAGTAGNTLDSMDGIKKMINIAIAAGTTIVLSTGTPSNDPVTWCNQVEAFMKLVPELYWTVPMDLNMSRILALRYTQGRRIKYNSTWNQVSVLKTVEDFESVTIASLGSLKGSNKIWMTPKLNAIMPVKALGNKDIVKIETAKRYVNMMTDVWVGVGFIDDGLMFTNDVELS